MNEARRPKVHLSARDVTMHYGFRTILGGISLDVREGRPLAVTGPNGAGKSTLMKILAGVLTPTGGEVNLSVEGADISADDRAHRVGLVSPDLALYPQLSARETLDFLVRVRGLAPEAQPAGAQPAGASGVLAVLARVGLGDRADDRVGTFSTGMRQRLRIATALLHDPPLLLLDEPGATLDASGRDLVASLVADSARAVVLATNDPDEAALCGVQISVV